MGRILLKLHYLWLALLAAIVLWPISSPALTIVRWGGDARPSVPEDEGVELLHSPWTDLHEERGGRAVDLDFDPTFIGTRRLDTEHNIGPDVRARGGVLAQKYVAVIVDDDLETAWVAIEYDCQVAGAGRCDGIYGRQGTVDFDLGASFLLDRVRLVSGIRDPAAVVRDFRIHVAPELPNLSVIRGITRPLTPVAAEVRDNKLQRRDVDLRRDQRVRFLQLAVGQHDRPWSVAEFEIYVRGFLERATWRSDVLDFAEPVVWGPLSWRGRRGEPSVVAIQTRSGSTPDPDRYWRFTGRGGEKEVVSGEHYQELRVGERGGTTLDRAHWSTWSAPYDFADSSGTPVVSASPRRYFQLRVDFHPNGEEAEVRSVEMRVSPPLATGLVGEIWPVTVTAGESSSFTYALRPDLRSGDPGFDRLELTTPSLLEAIDSLHVGDQAVPFTVPALEPHRAVVSFAPLGAADSGALVEVFFRARVLQYGARFEARVSHSQRPREVAQFVNPGNATGDLEGRGVAVATTVGDGLLRADTDVALLTPNGDGVNDEACILFDILDVTAAVPVRVDILDLTARVVRRLYEGRDGHGRHRRCWDGRDGAGALAPPGVYVYRVSLELDDREVSRVGVLGLAF